MPAADPEPPSSGRDSPSAGPSACPNDFPVLELLLEVDADVSDDLPDHAFLLDWARHALDATLDRAVPFARAELSMRLLDTDAMRALNRDWRGRDAPTNVLSFPSGLPVLEATDEDALLVLGDVALCPAVIDEEARAQEKPPADHWAHLVVHGVLHLRGLDHESDHDARHMEALETRLLRARDLPDPYGERARS